MDQSLQLRSPFAQDFLVDDDLDFVAVSMAVWGLAVERWRDGQMRALNDISVALDPLKWELNACMVDSVRKVALEKQPGFIALLTAILRWPDYQQPS